MSDELAARRRAHVVMPTMEELAAALVGLSDSSARLSDEMGRLGDGVVTLADEWTESHPEQSKELRDLLCKRGRWA